MALKKWSQGEQVNAPDLNSNFAAVQVSLIGMIFPFAGTSSPPDGFLLCDGSEYANNSYENLVRKIASQYGINVTTDFTVDTSTNQISASNHGLSTDDILLFTSSGTLPSPLSANNAYFIVKSSSDTFKVSTEKGGDVVDITDTGSGTHSYHEKFKVPDMIGRVPVGVDPNDSRLSTHSSDIGDTGGTEYYQLEDNEMPSHFHDFDRDITSEDSGIQSRNDKDFATRAYVDSYDSNYDDNVDIETNEEGQDQPHENVQPYQTVRYVIRA